MSKITITKNEFDTLRKKASVLEEILDLAEEKYLGYLMEKTEDENSVSLIKAKKLLK